MKAGSGLARDDDDRLLDDVGLLEGLGHRLEFGCRRLFAEEPRRLDHGEVQLHAFVVYRVGGLVRESHLDQVV